MLLLREQLQQSLDRERRATTQLEALEHENRELRAKNRELRDLEKKVSELEQEIKRITGGTDKTLPTRKEAVKEMYYREVN